MDPDTSICSEFTLKDQENPAEWDALLLASSKKNQEKGLVSLAKIPVCAESAHYATHPNNHIPYIIDSLHSSRASALRNGNGML